jgi:hypothetical protein
MNVTTSTTREAQLHRLMVMFFSAYGFNHEGARHLWNRIVAEFGDDTVPYLNELCPIAVKAQALFGFTDAERQREYFAFVDEADAVIERCVRGPLF